MEKGKVSRVADRGARQGGGMGKGSRTPRVDTAVAIADARVLHLIARSDRAVVPGRAILLKPRWAKSGNGTQYSFSPAHVANGWNIAWSPPYARRPMAADKDRDRDVCEA